MEYLAIIAFVGLIIFKAIKKGKNIIEDEMHKTMLPGKRATSTKPDSEKSCPPGFGNYDTEEERLMNDPKVFSKTKVRSQASKKNSATASAQPPSAKSSQGIKLNSKEEARRAILYSEIFNRKY